MKFITCVASFGILTSVALQGCSKKDKTKKLKPTGTTAGNAVSTADGVPVESQSSEKKVGSVQEGIQQV